MSRKFVGRKELNFINAITRELIRDVIGQEVIYYEVIVEKTKTNNLYNEAIDKIYAAPVKINSLVYFENSTETVTNFSADSKFNIDVHISTAELVELNVAPKMGDFMQFGDIVYEIYTVTRPQMIFGQIDQKVMTKCTCGPARQGQFGAKKMTIEARYDLNAPKYSEQPSSFTLKGGSNR